MKKYDEGGGVQKETFGEAYARNRRMGEKTFTWNGKKFTTESKEEKTAREGAAMSKGYAKAAEKVNQADDVPKAAPKAKAIISSEDVSPPAGTKLSYESSRAYPIESRSVPKGGGGGGGTRVEPMLGADLDPKRIVGKRMEPSFKRGGKVSSNASYPKKNRRTK